MAASASLERPHRSARSSVPQASLRWGRRSQRAIAHEYRLGDERVALARDLYDLVALARDLVSRARDLVALAHDLVSRARDLVARQIAVVSLSAGVAPLAQPDRRLMRDGR